MDLLIWSQIVFIYLKSTESNPFDIRGGSMLLKKIVLHYDNEYGEEEEVQHIGVKMLNETGEQNNIKSSILTHFIWGFHTLRTEWTTG